MTDKILLKTEKGVVLEKKYGYLLIDGKYYEFATKDGQPILKQIPTEEVEEQKRKAEQIAEKLKDGVDAEKILMENLMKLPKTDLKKLYKIVFESKRNYKARTRAHHCVDMKVGNFIIPLVD